MIMTVNEAYQLYKMKHGENSYVGKSKFASLTPHHVLLVSKAPHNVCQCKYHSNVILMLESLHKKLPMIPLCSRREFLPLCVCSVDDEDCMSSQYEDCTGKFEENITNNISDEVLYSSIRYSQWEENDGNLAPTVHTSTVLHCLQELQAQLPQFLWHAYIKQKQADSYEAHKLKVQNDESGSVLLQMDFAENATCVMQDEIQSAHWKQKHISMYTVMWYHRNHTVSIVILSDSTDHEKRTVSAHTYEILKDITNECSDAKEILIWSDGPSSQFKNKYLFALTATLQQKRPE